MEGEGGEEVLREREQRVGLRPSLRRATAGSGDAIKVGRRIAARDRVTSERLFGFLHSRLEILDEKKR